MFVDASFWGQLADVFLTTASLVETAYTSGDSQYDPRLVYVIKTVLLVVAALFCFVMAWRWKRMGPRATLPSDPRQKMYQKAMRDERAQEKAGGATAKKQQ